MKKIYAAILLLLFLLLTPFFVLAQEDFTFDQNLIPRQRDEVVTLPQDQIIDKDYFATGDVVEISGTVNGDVYAAGKEVLIDGIVNGDVLVAGGTVSISGKVAEDVRVAGGQVNISGEIGKNLTVGAGSVEVSSDALLSGNLVAGAGNVNILAPVQKDVKVGAGNLVLANTVGGDVEAGVGKIRLSPKARIEGNLIYWSDDVATIARDATVSGRITHNVTPEYKGPKPGDLAKVLISLAAFFKFVSLVSTLVIGLLLIYLFPGFIRTSAQTISKSPWVSLGVGLLVLILVPISFVVLLMTVVAVPLAFILLLLYFAAVFIARIYSIYWIGEYVSSRFDRKVNMGWTFVGGLAVYYLVSLIPVIGEITGFLVLLFGLGASAIAKRNLYLSFRKKNLI
ncbi:hypothetical protein HYS97_00560 [Candidatus Daviesbacteria bacterium]|nr:hypothetical protein [Candidatus Daviesbacteria bacterium]